MQDSFPPYNILLPNTPTNHGQRMSVSASFCWFRYYLTSIQGAKAAQKRERNADKNGPKGSKSQAKVNEAAKSIVCHVCRQSFVSDCLSPSFLVTESRPYS